MGSLWKAFLQHMLQGGHTEVNRDQMLESSTQLQRVVGNDCELSANSQRFHVDYKVCEKITSQMITKIIQMEKS